MPAFSAPPWATRFKRLLTLLAFLPVSQAFAATLTWTGAAADGHVETAGNWSPAQAPSAGDVLIFGGASSLLPQLAANLSVGSITFNSTAGAFTLGGTAGYTVGTSGITNSSTAIETIATSVTLGGAQSWNASAGALVFSGRVINAGNLLTINGAQSTTISGAISGTGGLTKTGAGTLTLSGANTFSGAVTLSAGNVAIGSNQAFGTASVSLSGASLSATGTARTLTNALSLKASTTINGSQDLTFTGAVGQANNYTLTVDNTGTTTFSGGWALSTGKQGKTLTVSGAGNTVVNSVISNGTRNKTGSLIKTGAGTLTLSGSSANTFTGTVTVNAGTLLLGKTSGVAVPRNLTVGDGTGTDVARLLGSEQIYDSAVVALNTGGTLDLNGFTETVASISGTGTAQLGAGTLNVGGTNTSTTFAGTLTGAGSLVKNGTGTLTLTGPANAPGNITANAGTVALGAAGAVSSATVLGASGAGIVSLGTISQTASGVSLSAGSVQTGTGTLTLVGDSTAVSAGGTAAVLSGFVALSGQRTFTVNAGGAATDLTLSAKLTGTGGLTKAGAGVLLLSGANTYGGATAVNAGTLRLAGGAALPDATALTFANTTGAVLDLAGTSETVGSIAGGGAAGGNITLGAGTLTLGGNGSTTYAGAISGAGGLTKNGSGALTLSGANTFTGSFTVNAGGISAGSDTALPATAALFLANATGVSLDVANHAVQVGSLSGGGALGGGVTLGSGTLSVGAANSSTTYTGVISGSGGVTKTGTGTLSLTSASTFGGALRVDGGTLTFAGTAGSAPLAGSVSIATGATLYLDNTAGNSNARIADAAPIILGGGTLKLASASTGTAETVGALQLSGGSSQILVVNNSATGTALTFNGLGSVAPNATVNFSGTGGTLGASALGPQIYITGQATGFIGGWATVGADFAEYSTFGVRAFAGYYTGALGINVNDAAQIPLLASTSPLSAYTLTRAGTTIDKALSLTDAPLVDLGLLSTNTLNLASGGLLKSTTTATAISGAGRLTAGATAAGDLVVSVNSGSTLAISAPIIDNAGPNGTYGDADDGVVSLEAGGAGTLILSGPNTYTGGNQLDAGTVRIAAENHLGAAANGVTFNGGTLQLTAGFTASAAKIFTVKAGQSGTLDIAVGQTLTLGAAANTLRTEDAAAVLHKAGTGTLIVPTANSLFTGTVQIDAGTLDLRAAQAIGGTLSMNGGALTLRADMSSAFATAVALQTSTTIDVERLTGSTPAVVHSLGALTIGASTLTATGSTGAALAFDSVTLTGNATFSPTTANLSLGAISGSFGITKTGAGLLTLTGASSYTGTTTVSAGTLRIGAANATSPYSALTLSGTQLDLNGFNTAIGSLAGSGTVTLGSGMLTTGGDDSSTSFSGQISGAGSLTKTGAGTLTLSGANSFTGATSISGGTLQLGASERIGDSSAVTVSSGATLNLNGFNEAIGSLAGAGNVALGAGALTAGGNHGSTVFSGVLSGAGTLTKTGSGTLTVAGANTFSGATSVAAGVLLVQADSGLGATSAGTTVASGAELQLQADVDIGAEPLSLNGSGTSGAGALRSVSGANTWAGPITLATAATIGASAGSLGLSGDISKGANALTVAGAGNVSLDGVISGSGTTGLILNSTGTVVLSNANGYTGTTLVTSGALVVTDASALGANGAADGTTVASGATLRLEDDVALAIGTERLTMSGAGVGGMGALLSALGDNSWAGVITLAGDSTVNVITDTLALNGGIGETGGARGLTKIGAGSLSLAAVNTFTGPLLVSEGVLDLASGSLAATSITVAANGELSFASGATLAAGTTLTAHGGVTFNSATVTVGTLNGASTGTVTLNGTALSVSSGSFAGLLENGASAGRLTKTGAGTLVLTGSNTQTGGITISAGVLAVNNSAALGAGTITLGGGTLRLDAPMTIARTLTLNAASSIDSNGNDVVLSGSISGTVGLTKFGTGMLEITSTNAGFTGLTDVAAGRLRISGSTGGDVTADLGGFVDGGGSTGAIIAHSGSTIAPGNGVGTLTTRSVTLESGSQLQLEIAGPGSQSDQLNLTGSLTLGGSVQVSLLGGYIPAGGDKFFLILNDGTDAISGTFAGLAQGATLTVGGSQFLISYTGNSATNAFTGGNDVVLQAVPEPSSLSGLLAGATVLAARPRRSRRK